MKCDLSTTVYITRYGSCQISSPTQSISNTGDGDTIIDEWNQMKCARGSLPAAGDPYKPIALNQADLIVIRRGVTILFAMDDRTVIEIWFCFVSRHWLGIPTNENIPTVLPVEVRIQGHP